MVLTVARLVVCVTGAVYGRSAVAQRFEVASIKLSNAGPNSTSGIHTGHGRLDANNVTLKRCNSDCACAQKRRRWNSS
jgi:hypothetical protein